jgi:transketolase
MTTALLDRRDDIAVVLAVIGAGLFAETGVSERHPHRIIDVGIREQTMIGVASGMALEGYRPIAHSYAPFLVERAFEQIKLDFVHQGVGGILVSVGASHDWAAGGRSHMAPGDVALLRTLPGWEIHVPGHPDDVQAVLLDAAGHDRPVYIRLSERSNIRSAAAPGSIHIVRPGSSSSPGVLAVGPMLDPVLDATIGLDVTVAHAVTVQPLDSEGLRSLAGSGDLVLVEPYLRGTSTAAVVDTMSDRRVRILSLGVGPEELRTYGTAEEHDRAWSLDADGLRRSIRRFVGGGHLGTLVV